MSGRFQRALLTNSTDGASLAAFRILFGSTMAVAMVRFVALGWVEEFYVAPAFHFTWEAFPWIVPLPAPLMRLLFTALALLAVAIAVGLYYRLAAAAFFVGFTYVELLDKATYLNHYYLASLLSGLLIFLPAANLWSVDAWRRPGRTSHRIPSWPVNLLRFQLAVVYLFAGVAKINSDWLIDAQPMRIWLAARSDLPLAGPFLAQIWVAYAFSWIGAIYDLAIVLFLLWPRTRFAAYVTVILFHAMTAVLFPIGMFPWLMIVATLLFFPPDWPRRWLVKTETAEHDVEHRVSRRLGILLAVYAVVQIVVPLRAYWPGTDPEWTNRGFNFAWRVMIAEKAGYTELIAADRSTGREWPVRLSDYVTERQQKMMAQDPFMVRALARQVAADLQRRGLDVVVRAESFASLNGRPVQRLIDPRVDFARPLPKDWIVVLASH